MPAVQDTQVGRPQPPAHPAAQRPLEGAGGGSKAGGGGEGVPSIKRLPSTPLGPGPISFWEEGP